MTFIKGYKQSEEHKRKLSVVRKGKQKSKSTIALLSKIGKQNYILGKNIPPNFGAGERSPSWKGGLPSCVVCQKKLSVRGLTYCMKHVIKAKYKRSSYYTGINHHNWKGGKVLTEAQKVRKERAIRTGRHPNYIEDRSTLKKQNRRNDSLYKEWRTKVYKRDLYKCKISNKDCCGSVEAHHIIGWSKDLSLRYEVNNGITLCKFHHPRTRKDEERLSPYLSSLITLIKN